AWLRRLGAQFTAEESDAVMQLWRYSGYLVGVDPTLLPATEAEARRLGALYEATQEPPDVDSRALVRALIEAAPTLLQSYVEQTGWVPGAVAALSRFFLGDARSDDLGIPQSALRVAIPLLRTAIAQGETLRKLAPGGSDFVTRVGTAFERGIVEADPANLRGD